MILLTISLIIIKSEDAPQQPTNKENTENNQKNITNNPLSPPSSSKNNLADQINQTNIDNGINTNNITDKAPQKEFNLTESLINFFNQMFGSNNTNKTVDKSKELEEEKKRIEEQKMKEKIEKIRLDAENAQKMREKQRQLQLEKEREEFERKIENITVGEYTNLFLEGKSGELLYHNITKPCNLKIAFLLTDSGKTIHLNFNGPNGKKGTTLIQSFRSRNFLYYEYKAQYIGQYTFYLNNYHNSDETEIIFAISDDNIKTDDKLGKKNIDKISGYLNDIDFKINQMKAKQNIINKKTNTHNESINKHNREIVIYSIIEVITMLLVFVIQTCYIKNIVEKL